ncbi:energy transducer TonB [Lysobacter auxotrophicus]|uniref:energy transducer TonB n=1 Tax=Lysobacter auxotrophicus TaxID=2992573 RepID=UPI003CCD6C8B
MQKRSRLTGSIAALSALLSWSAAFTQEKVPPRLEDGSAPPSDERFIPAEPIDSLNIPYPAEFLRLGYAGTYEADLLISPSGEVTEVKVLKTVHPAFNRVITKQVRQLRFKPALLDGAPTAEWFRYSARYWQERAR